MSGGFCTRAELGRFILNLPAGKSINDTSFWSTMVELPANSKNGAPSASANDLWDNPAGNPTPPPTNNTSPWRLRATTSPRASSHVLRQMGLNASSSGVYHYNGPIQYNVRKTGYYCVGMLHHPSMSCSTCPLLPHHPSHCAGHC